MVRNVQGSGYLRESGHGADASERSLKVESGLVTPARGWPSPVRRRIANPVVISPRGFKRAPGIPGARNIPLPAFLGRRFDGLATGPVDLSIAAHRNDGVHGR